MPGSRPLDLEEIAAINAICLTARERALALIFAGTGLRINELRSAKRRSVLTADGTMTKRIHIPAAATKRQLQARIVPLPQPAVDALSEWLAEHPSNDPEAALFPSNRDVMKPLTVRQVQRLITAMAQRAGLEGKVTAHSFRKYFGRTMHKALGEDLNKTARALGHKDPKSTMYYLDDAREEIERAAAGSLPAALSRTPQLETA